MMVGNLLKGEVGYFTNCFTDILGYQNKIKNISISDWSYVNDSSNQCFDVKLNHAKYNLYYKEIDVLNTKNLDNKTMYIFNSIKMPMRHCSSEYMRYYNKPFLESDKIIIYRQNASEIFENQKYIFPYYSCILFIDIGQNASPFVYKHNGDNIEFLPENGSLLILPPNTEYEIGKSVNNDFYYANYFFSDII